MKLSSKHTLRICRVTRRVERSKFNHSLFCSENILFAFLPAFSFCNYVQLPCAFPPVTVIGILLSPPTAVQFNSSFVVVSNFHLFAKPSFHINHSLHFPLPYQMLSSELPSAWPPHLGGEVREVTLCIQVEPPLCLWGWEIPLACLGTQ